MGLQMEKSEYMYTSMLCMVCLVMYVVVHEHVGVCEHKLNHNKWKSIYKILSTTQVNNKVLFREHRI